MVSHISLTNPMLTLARRRQIKTVTRHKRHIDSWTLRLTRKRPNRFLLGILYLPDSLVFVKGSLNNSNASRCAFNSIFDVVKNDFVYEIFWSIFLANSCPAIVKFYSIICAHEYAGVNLGLSHPQGTISFLGWKVPYVVHQNASYITSNLIMIA